MSCPLCGTDLLGLDPDLGSATRCYKITKDGKNATGRQPNAPDLTRPAGIADKRTRLALRADWGENPTVFHLQFETEIHHSGGAGGGRIQDKFLDDHPHSRVVFAPRHPARPGGTGKGECGTRLTLLT